MNENIKNNFVSRNKSKVKVIGSDSRNELMEKNKDEGKDNNNIKNEEIKEKKKANQRRIKFIDNKDEISSSISKRSGENNLLLKPNHGLKNALNKIKYEDIKNTNYNINDFPKDKIVTFTYNRNNFNKKTIEDINFNETENNISFDDENKNNKINYNEKENEKTEGIDLNEVYSLIMGYNFNKVIETEFIQTFFLSSVPEGKTLSMNINKLKKKANNPNNINFNFNLEILKNNQIYYFAYIKKSFPSSNIKIYIKDFNNQYIKVGKIISNVLKNNFILFKGNNKSNYEKILIINYEYNFFGNKIRKMQIEKLENNAIKYTLCNILPEWDYEYKTYKLNFNGRVKQMSKKNFILKYQNLNDKANNNEKILQCGKINDYCYALDFIHPLTPLEAFSISISSIIYKISCE